MLSNAQERSRQQQSIVLVIDDNAAIRDMVSWALELDGFEPAEASEGEEALAWMDNAAREGRYPAVILLDLVMPGMDGYTFLQRLQTRWERPLPAIVLITASQMVPEHLRSNVNQVIIKPFHVRDLLNVVRDLTI